MLTKDDVEFIIKARQNGMKVKEIANLLGKTTSTIYQIYRNKVGKYVPDYKEKIQKNIIIDKVSGCWLWQGSQSRGNGQISYKSEIYKTHRLAYELWIGEVPPHYHVRHTCGVSLCCNPNHLIILEKNRVFARNLETPKEEDWFL